MRKETLRKAKTENLIRLAKWLKIRTKRLSHYELVERIFWKITFG